MALNPLAEVAKSKSTANRLAKSLSAAELKKAIDNLQSALTGVERRESAKVAKKQATDLKKLKAMVAKMGLSAKDLRKLTATQPKLKAGGKKAAAKRKAAAKKGPKKGTKVAPKYQLKAGKQTHKWTGRGRMPLVFKEHVAKGGSLEKCLIK